MNRRSILKAIILAPFVGLISKVRKKFRAKLKFDEVYTVPEGKTLQIDSMWITTIDSNPANSCTFTIEGYLIE